MDSVVLVGAVDYVENTPDGIYHPYIWGLLALQATYIRVETL
jgi:hypothetical protein